MLQRLTGEFTPHQGAELQENRNSHMARDEPESDGETAALLTQIRPTNINQLKRADRYPSPRKSKVETIQTHKATSLGPGAKGVAFFNDGHRVVTGCKVLGIWDVQKWTLMEEPFKGHRQDRVCSVTVSPDNRRIASGRKDNRVITWNVENRQIRW